MITMAPLIFLPYLLWLKQPLVNRAKQVYLSDCFRVLQPLLVLLQVRNRRELTIVACEAVQASPLSLGRSM